MKQLKIDFKINQILVLACLASACNPLAQSPTTDANFGASGPLAPLLLITGLSNDLTPALFKTWNFNCSDDPCTYRSAVDSNPTWAGTGNFGSAHSVTATGNEGTTFLHVQAKNLTGTLSEVFTVSTVLYQNLSVRSATVSSSGRSIILSLNVPAPPLLPTPLTLAGFDVKINGILTTVSSVTLSAPSEVTLGFTYPLASSDGVSFSYGGGTLSDSSGFGAILQDLEPFFLISSTTPSLINRPRTQTRSPILKRFKITGVPFHHLLRLRLKP